MTDPLFLSDLPDPLPGPGQELRLEGSEGRHAAVVRRIGPGETVVVSDGSGRGLRCSVIAADRTGLRLAVTEIRQSPPPRLRVVVVQALAKGDRSELACEMLTELGVDEIVPWPAGRSIVRWQGERGAKSLARWRTSVREAAKQSRRLRVPEVTEPMSSRLVAARLTTADLALVLHERADQGIDRVRLPRRGEIVLVVGPEGGISEQELELFEAAGARAVLISDGVLRTSTAGAAALAQLQALVGVGRGPDA